MMSQTVSGVISRRKNLCVQVSPHPIKKIRQMSLRRWRSSVWASTASASGPATRSARSRCNCSDEGHGIMIVKDRWLLRTGFLGFGLPQFDRPVPAAGGQGLAVRAEAHRRDEARVSLEGGAFLT